MNISTQEYYSMGSTHIMNNRIFWVTRCVPRPTPINNAYPLKILYNKSKLEINQKQDVVMSFFYFDIKIFLSDHLYFIIQH